MDALGFYGKLPSQGDFVSRRLPWEFTAAWDDWVQQGLASAKARSPCGWLRAYLVAPVWRFQLRPGVVGPHGWIGFWFPSVDRVGRHYPVSFATRLPGGWQEGFLLLEADDELRRLEEIALAGLDPQLALEHFDASIVSAGISLSDVGAGPMEGDGAANLGLRRFSIDASLAGVLGAVRTTLPGAASFFTWGSNTVAPTLLECNALPAPSQFGLFLGEDMASLSPSLASGGP